MEIPPATLVLPDHKDDYGSYLSAKERLRPVVGFGGRLYIGDRQMAASRLRAYLHHGGDCHLVPLPITGGIPSLLDALLQLEWSKRQSLELIYASGDDSGSRSEVRNVKRMGLGYETTRLPEGLGRWPASGVGRPCARDASASSRHAIPSSSGTVSRACRANVARVGASAGTKAAVVT